MAPPWDTEFENAAKFVFFAFYWQQNKLILAKFGM